MADWGDASEAHSKREREAARLLRKSRWWQTRLQQGVCYYCAKHVTKAAATMDHVVPLAQGGRTTAGNVVLACKPCNSQKRDLTAAAWLLYLEAARSQSVDPGQSGQAPWLQSRIK